MTSSHIPSRWLTPKKRPGDWLFQCSIDLPTLVRNRQATNYFRLLLNLIEDRHHIVDYHLKLRHNFRRHYLLDVVLYFGSPVRTVNPSPTPVCISCESEYELSAASLLSEQQYTRAWLDCRDLPRLVVTPNRHIERLSQLTDENGETESVWQDVVDLITREIGYRDDFYPNIIINHGTYRNHAHLHLKIEFPKAIWRSTIVPRYEAKLEECKRLLQDPTFVADCFGQTYEKKKKPKKQPNQHEDQQ